MSSKKESQIKHAIKRAKQRFELSLTKTDLIDIVRNIQNNIDCVFIKKQSNRVSIFIIKTNNIGLSMIKSENLL